jgi:5-methyltetrahydropteroyltriglutamate--homocysteine methyltransferase
MPIPTEPIGSVPRPKWLMDAVTGHAEERVSDAELAAAYDKAVEETIKAMAETGSPVLTDGEQSKPSFATYPVAGLRTLAFDGVVIPFADGHQRQLPRLTEGPFRYTTYAGGYVTKARAFTDRPIKQAVIAPSALSLLYPASGIDDYSQEQFIADLVNETEKDIRSAFDAGAASVQIDFTEGRLSCKLDPSGGILKQFVALNNAVLDRFSDAERAKIGVHTCPGGDQNATHSADVDYLELLPDLFEIKAGNFFVQMASEADHARALGAIKDVRKPDQRVFVGVIDPIDMAVESPETVRDRIVEAAEYIPVSHLGSTDDCGFSPFGDDLSTAREIAFAKIKARVEGNALAEAKLGV